MGWVCKKIGAKKFFDASMWVGAKIPAVECDFVDVAEFLRRLKMKSSNRFHSSGLLFPVP